MCVRVKTGRLSREGGTGRPMGLTRQAARLGPEVVAMLPRFCKPGSIDASTAPPPTGNCQKHQPGDPLTSATCQTRAPIRAAAIPSHRRAARLAAIRMSVRPLPARQPGRALIVLRVRRLVPGTALPATTTPLGPGGLPRLDKRVLFASRKTPAPRPEKLAHHCLDFTRRRVPPLEVHRDG